MYIYIYKENCIFNLYPKSDSYGAVAPRIIARILGHFYIYYTL